MLDTIGRPVLAWLEEEVIPEAFHQLDRFNLFVMRWRDLLEDRP